MSRWAGRATLPFVAVVMTAASTGCSPPPASGSAAPPTRFCGQTLVDSAAGSTVTDATNDDVTVDFQTSGGVVLQTSTDCARGSSIAVDPPDALHVTAEATAKDGGLAGVALQPTAPCATITVTHADGSRTTVHVALSGCTTVTG